MEYGLGSEEQLLSISSLPPPPPLRGWIRDPRSFFLGGAWYCWIPGIRSKSPPLGGSHQDLPLPLPRDFMPLIGPLYPCMSTPSCGRRACFRGSSYEVLPACDPSWVGVTITPFSQPVFLSLTSFQTNDEDRSFGEQRVYPT